MTKLWVSTRGDEVVFIQKTDNRFCVLDLDAGGSMWGGELHELKERLLGMGCDPSPVETPMVSGAYHHGMWRGEFSPEPTELDGHTRWRWTSSIRAARLLYAKMNTLINAVEPSAEHDQTYGFLQREILLLACTEVESACKSVLEMSCESESGRDDRWSTRDYVKLLKPMKLDRWEVTLSAHHGYRPMRPFGGWDPRNPTQSLPWYHAYNKVKHAREENLKQATFGHVMDALAAVFVMTAAQFGPPRVDDDQDFHPDEFTIRTQPDWLPTERYVRPSRNCTGGWLGHEKWTHVACPALRE